MQIPEHISVCQQTGGFETSERTKMGVRTKPYSDLAVEEQALHHHIRTDMNN